MRDRYQEAEPKQLPVNKESKAVCIYRTRALFTNVERSRMHHKYGMGRAPSSGILHVGVKKGAVDRHTGGFSSQTSRFYHEETAMAGLIFEQPKRLSMAKRVNL